MNPLCPRCAARCSVKHGRMRTSVLESVETVVSPTATITTNEHPRYASEISNAYPKMVHTHHRSIRGSLTGQGELKRTGFDPLFTINHTLAMMRDNIKRLTRRTWCTTKVAKSLDDVIAIYQYYHNSTLIPQPEPQPDCS